MTEPARLLIVEDEAVVALDLQRRVERLGHRVVGLATSGEAAIEKAQELLPDLALMDVRLKGDMDGVTAAQEIRRRADVPVVFLTAYGDSQTAQRATATEPFGYVLKPVDDRELEIAISVAVQRHQAELRIKQVSDALREAQKLEALGRLSAGVAHEFNNLMSVVLVGTGMMLSSPELPLSLRKVVKDIERAGERAGVLTKQLLTFGRKQAFRTDRLDLGFVVAEMAGTLEQCVGERVVLITNVPDGQTITGDRAQIEQMLTSLASNSRDAMPDGGTLTISTRRDGAMVVLEVRDTGIGMNQNVLDRMFEPFFTTKEVGKGTGLGLAAVYGMVVLANGRIEVDSAPAQGTTIRIYFPAYGLWGTDADSEA